MRFPVPSRAKATAHLDVGNKNPQPADIPPSQHTPTSQIEKETTLSRASSRQKPPNEQEKKVVESTTLSEAEAIDNLSDEPEYPSGVKLGIIIASLSLSVFLMALVRPILSSCYYQSILHKIQDTCL